MINFDEYAEYQLIPSDFTGTIIFKIKTDKNGNFLMDFDTCYEMFQAFQKQFPNNKVIGVPDNVSVEGYIGINEDAQ